MCLQHKIYVLHLKSNTNSAVVGSNHLKLFPKIYVPVNLATPLKNTSEGVHF